MILSMLRSKSKQKSQSIDLAFLASNEDKTNRYYCGERGAIVVPNSKDRYSWLFIGGLKLFNSENQY